MLAVNGRRHTMDFELPAADVFSEKCDEMARCAACSQTYHHAIVNPPQRRACNGSLFVVQLLRGLVRTHKFEHILRRGIRRARFCASAKACTDGLKNRMHSWKETPVVYANRAAMLK